MSHHVSFNNPSNVIPINLNDQHDPQDASNVISTESKTKEQIKILKDPPPKPKILRQRSNSSSPDVPQSVKNTLTPSITSVGSISNLNSNSEASSSPMSISDDSPTTQSKVSSSDTKRTYSKRKLSKNQNYAEYYPLDSSSSPKLDVKVTPEQSRKAIPALHNISSTSPQRADSSPTIRLKEDSSKSSHSEGSSSSSPKDKQKEKVEKTHSFHLNLIKTFRGSSPRSNSPSSEDRTRERRTHMQRMHSFHAGMKKIAPLSNEPLSLLSPPLSARRNYIPPSISNSDQESSFDISSLSEFTDKHGITEFDELGKKNIKAVWDSHAKPEISSKIIEECIDKACRSEIDQLFKQKNGINLHLILTESPRTKHLLRFIKFGGIPLKQVLERLQILQTGIKKYMDLTERKTAWSELLYTSIEKLLKLDHYTSTTYYGLTQGRDIFNFLTIVDEILEQKEYSKVKKIILLAFGDNEKTQKSVLATLRKWCNTDEAELKENVHEISQEAQLASSISFYRHYWEEDGAHPLTKVTVKEIQRCLKLQEYVNFDKITVNKKIIHEDKDKKNLEVIEDNEFYFKLFKAIYRSGFDKKAKDENIADHIEYLLNKHKPEDTEEIISKALPCVNLLRLATSTSWLRCNDCIRFLFPGLYRSPYIVKALEGMECHIKIKNDKNFNVELVRSYGVFFKENPLDPTSTTPDLKQKLATIPFSWTTFPSWEPSQDESESGAIKILGKLVVSNPIMEENIANNDKSYILQSIINFTDAELVVDEPNTPRIESILEFPKK